MHLHWVQLTKFCMDLPQAIKLKLLDFTYYLIYFSFKYIKLNFYVINLFLLTFKQN